MASSILRIFQLLVAASIAALSACGGGSSMPNPGPGPNTPSQHLYVSTGTQILQYSLPLTTTSVPSAVLPIAAGPVAVDSNGNLATTESSAHLLIFTAPITSSSTPSATFLNVNADPQSGSEFVAFAPNGDLVATAVSFAGGVRSSQVNVYTHPFSSATTVSQVIKPPGFTNASGVALDGSGNLYMASTGIDSGGPLNVISAFTPPWTGAPVTTQFHTVDSFAGAVTISSTQLFVCVDSFVGVYNLPITTGSTIAASLTMTTNTCSGVAVDSTGKLYAVDPSGIRVYAPPFSSSSAPILTLGGVRGPIAVGK